MDTKLKNKTRQKERPYVFFCKDKMKTKTELSQKCRTSSDLVLRFCCMYLASSTAHPFPP